MQEEIQIGEVLIIKTYHKHLWYGRQQANQL